jgi:DNA-binding CsgD family transcriptional regulator
MADAHSLKEARYTRRTSTRMSLVAHRAPIEQTPFLGRDEELGEIGALLAEARAGKGRFLLIGGDAGVGKTRICEEAGTSAREVGFRVRSGHCVEGDAVPPYLPFAEILTSPEPGVPSDTALAALPDELKAALAMVAPQLGGLAGSAPEVTQEHQRQFLFSAVREYLDRASRREPQLLIIEDLHWSDAPTLLLLRHLLHFVPGRPLLLLATYRPNELRRVSDATSSGLEGLIDLLNRGRAGRSIELREFDRVGVGAMLRALLDGEPSTDAVEAVLEQTGGNPFFIEQLVKHLSEEGRLPTSDGRWEGLTEGDVPESVRLVIERRLQHLDRGCAQLLALAALIGRRFDIDLVTTVAGVDHDTALDALDVAERLRLVTTSQIAGRVSGTFAHDLIRQTLRMQLSRGRRQRLHLEIAEAIERSGVRHEERATELADHYLKAGSAAKPERTAEILGLAAGQALASTAYEEAARLYGHSLEYVEPGNIRERCELHLRIGEALKRVSDSDAARAAFGAGAELAVQLGDRGQLARAALGFARSWPTIASVDGRAVGLLEEALAASPTEDLALRSKLQSRLALQRLYSGGPEDVMAEARAAVATARASGDAMTLARALQVLHVTLWEPRHLEERLATATEIIELSGEVDRSVVLWGLRPRIADLMERGEVTAAERDLDEYDRVAQSVRQPIFIWQAAVRRAMMAIFKGRLDEGERLAQRALDLGRQAEGQNLIAAFGGQLLVIRWQQGRLVELEPLVKASLKAQPDAAIWQAVDAFIQLKAGRTAEARAVFERLAQDGFAVLPRDDTRTIVLVLLTLVCSALGDGLRADQLYEKLQVYDGRQIVVSEGVACVGAGSHYLGMLAMAARRWERASQHFEDALAMNTATGGRPWLAHTQFEWARLLLARRQAGDRRNAGTLLRSALGIARDLGLADLQSSIEGVLRSHRRLAPERPDGLTPRETEVLRLLARGRSTREISEELVLSMRTTARHITNIYAKIGARNRVEASAYARQHNLVG